MIGGSPGARRALVGVVAAALVFVSTGGSAAAQSADAPTPNVSRDGRAHPAPWAPAARRGQPQADTTLVSFFEIESRVPATWTNVEPSSSMRLLQMSAPGTDADAAAALVVYFFGQGQGGGLEANVERWSGQFSSPDGGPVEPVIESFDVGDIAVTLVELTGTYRRDAGGSRGQPVADQTLLAAIVDTGRGTLFVQLHGPAPAVAAQHAAFDAFLRAMKPTA